MTVILSTLFLVIYLHSTVSIQHFDELYRIQKSHQRTVGLYNSLAVLMFGVVIFVSILPPIISGQHHDFLRGEVPRMKVWDLGCGCCEHPRAASVCVA
jgi:hypothetical protein